MCVCVCVCVCVSKHDTYHLQDTSWYRNIGSMSEQTATSYLYPYISLPSSPPPPLSITLASTDTISQAQGMHAHTYRTQLHMYSHDVKYSSITLDHTLAGDCMILLYDIVLDIQASNLQTNRQLQSVWHDACSSLQ